jgi:hypothetical protein
MKPDRSNYEIWLTDYLDGSLDESRVSELFSFLKENPDLKQEFEEISGFKLVADFNPFFNKTHLKKTYSDLSAEQFDFLCVASVENDLDEETNRELGAIVNEDYERSKTLDLFRKTKLKAPDIKYNKKSGLRKLSVPQKVFRFSVVAVSAAAGLAIMISLFNSSVKSNTELLPLVTINLPAKIIKSDSPEKIIAENTINKEIRAKIKPAGIIVQNTLIPVAGTVIRTPGDKSSEAIISAGNPEIQAVNLSKADYKAKIVLVENTSSGTLAAMNTTVDIPAEVPEKHGLNALIARFFRDKIIKSEEPETGSLKPYEIADAGIIGLNKLLGWQMSLQKNHDEKGDLKSLYFSSKILKFNAPVRKVQLEP